MTYTTISGDTWDSIAYSQYGEERHADKIMDANPQHLDYMIFPDNMRLEIPEAETFAGAASVPTDYPAWRAALNGGST